MVELSELEHILSEVQERLTEGWQYRVLIEQEIKICTAVLQDPDKYNDTGDDQEVFVQRYREVLQERNKNKAALEKVLEWLVPTLRRVKRKIKKREYEHAVAAGPWC